ncbi:MAG: tetratricopeptide repeat protein [Kiritimatiellaeota bacterium]|nr:tetratricopeptide repeat protein [Kiritimatiellota bacterium]
MKHRLFKPSVLMLLLAPALFAQDFSIRAIEAALEDELYPLAEQQIWNALSIDRNIEEKTELTILLVRSLIGQQRYDDAVILTEESSHLLQQDAFTYWKARAYFEAGEIDSVFQTLETLPKNSTYLPAALRLKGRAADTNGDLRDAEKFFEQFEKQFPENENAAQNLLDLADINLKRGRGRPAVKTLNKLLERFPESAEANFARLLLARELIADDGKKEREEASELLTRLGSNETALARLRIAAWVELAALEKRMDRPAVAAEALLNAENLTAENVVRVRQKTARANLLMDEGKTKEAFDLFDETIQSAANKELATEVLIQKAEALLDDGQCAAAEQAFQACLNVTEQLPLQTRALSGKGWSLWEQERYEEAAVAFEQAAAKSTDPSDCVTTRVKAGDARLSAGQYELAYTNYQIVNQTEPTHPLAARASYQSGVALLRTGNIEEAQLQFRLTEADFPDSEFAPRAALQLAELLKKETQLDAALQEYIRIAGQYTDAATRATALHQQGLILFQFNRYADALNIFDSIAETYPDAAETPQAFYMRGFCRYLQGNAEEALAIFNVYVEKFPDSLWTPEVLFLVGEHAYNRGDYLRAQTTFFNIAKQFPQHDLADNSLFWAGNALLRQDNFIEAFSTYTRLAKEYPQSDLLLQTRFAQGEALTELGEFSRAILAYEEIIKTVPDNPLADRARGRLGDCLFTLGATEPGRYQEALAAYQMLYKRPGTPFALKLQALYKIARCNDKTGQSDRAFTRYMEAVYSIAEQSTPLSPEAALWFTRAAFEAAAIQEQQQNWKEAVHIYKRIVQAGVSAQNEAQNRIEKIQREHADVFQ